MGNLKYLIFLSLSIILGFHNIVFADNGLDQDIKKANYQQTQSISPPDQLQFFSPNSPWQIYGSSNVISAQLTQNQNKDNETEVRIDYEVGPQGGYFVSHRDINLDLPSDYQISFEYKYIAHPAEQPNALKDEPGSLPALEFKLFDETGLNVWWYHQKDFPLHINSSNSSSINWTPLSFSQAKIFYAWGPDAVKRIQKVSRIEIAFSFPKGAKGTIWFRRAEFKSNVPKSEPHVTWQHGQMGPNENLLIDLTQKRQLQSIFIDFPMPIRNLPFDPGKWKIEVSADAKSWLPIRHKSYFHNKTAYILLNPTEKPHLSFSQPIDSIQFIKFKSAAAHSTKPLNPPHIRILPADIGRDNFSLIRAISGDKPKGQFPKYVSGIQTYWAQVPMPVGPLHFKKKPKERYFHPAIMNEEGLLEIQPRGLSIEPMLALDDGKILNWSSAQKITIGLEDQYLPMPWSEWDLQDLKLKTTAFTLYQDTSERIWSKYEVSNLSDKPKKVNLLIVARPIPVTPPWQFLEPCQWMTNGVTKLKKIKTESQPILLGLPKSEDVTYEIQPVSDSGKENWSLALTSYSQQDYFEQSKSSLSQVNSDFPVGVFSTKLSLAPKQTKTLYILSRPQNTSSLNTYLPAHVSPSMQFKQARKGWESLLPVNTIKGPPETEKALRAMRSALVQILGNRLGPALQPGPRRYSTSWIRDGAVMGSSLLQMNIKEMPKTYLDWYTKFQFKDGFVPCCITGSKLEPDYIEYDSNGQFLFLISELYKYSRNKSDLIKLWPKVKSSVDFIQHLVRQNSKPEMLTNPLRKAFYGLIPASVSHEGYLGNPVHSYWDDYWTLRGLKDATYLAAELNKKSEFESWASFTRQFRNSLFASIHQTVIDKKLSYIPASVERGELDASATALAMSILDEANNLPQAELKNTIKLFWNVLSERIYGTSNSNQYGAYEIRMLEPLVRIGDRAKANEALNFFLDDQRPEPWNEWPEITWKDPRSPTGIGDLPHTWIAAEYARAIRSFFAYEHEESMSLYIADGIPDLWLTEKTPIEVNDLPTYHGLISYKLSGEIHSHPQYTRIQHLHFSAKWKNAPSQVIFRAPQGCIITDIKTKDTYFLNTLGQSISFQGSKFDATIRSKCERPPDEPLDEE